MDDRLENTSPNARFANSTRQPVSARPVVPPVRHSDTSGCYANRYDEARDVRRAGSSDANRVRYGSERTSADTRPSQYARTSRQDFGDDYFGRDGMNRQRSQRSGRILIDDDSLRMDKVTGVRERGSEESDQRLRQMRDERAVTGGRAGGATPATGARQVGGRPSGAGSARGGSAGGRPVGSGPVTGRPAGRPLTMEEAQRASNRAYKAQQSARQRQVYAKRNGNAWHSRRKEAQKRSLIFIGIIVVAVIAVVFGVASCVMN